MAVRRHRLAARRRALGLTQEALAERVGVDASTVRRWESGYIAGGPHPSIRRKLAEHLRISAWELEDLLTERDGLKDSIGSGQDRAVRFGLLSWDVADDEDDVNRRALLKLLGGAALAAPVGHLEIGRAHV